MSEVFINLISGDSPVCVMNGEVTPSQRLGDIPHSVWIAIHKKSGNVENALCTCFAGYMYIFILFICFVTVEFVLF